MTAYYDSLAKCSCRGLVCHHTFLALSFPVKKPSCASTALKDMQFPDYLARQISVRVVARHKRRTSGWGRECDPVIKDTVGLGVMSLKLPAEQTTHSRITLAANQPD